MLAIMLSCLPLSYVIQPHPSAFPELASSCLPFLIQSCPLANCLLNLTSSHCFSGLLRCLVFTRHTPFVWYAQSLSQSSFLSSIARHTPFAHCAQSLSWSFYLSSFARCLPFSYWEPSWPCPLHQVSQSVHLTAFPVHRSLDCIAHDSHLMPSPFPEDFLNCRLHLRYRLWHDHVAKNQCHTINITIQRVRRQPKAKRHPSMTRWDQIVSPIIGSHMRILSLWKRYATRIQSLMSLKVVRRHARVTFGSQKMEKNTHWQVLHGGSVRDVVSQICLLLRTPITDVEVHNQVPN